MAHKKHHKKGKHHRLHKMGVHHKGHVSHRVPQNAMHAADHGFFHEGSPHHAKGGTKLPGLGGGY